MIVFDLSCRDGGHRFEGWFASSEEFAHQQERGLVTCPVCGSAEVCKAVMAPNLGRKGNQMPVPVMKREPAPAPVAGGEIPAPVAEALRALAQVQAEALKSSRWVGQSFVEDARAMHYGEREVEAIHGQATPEEARALAEEGVEIAPILFPVAPPNEAN